MKVSCLEGDERKMMMKTIAICVALVAGPALAVTCTPIGEQLNDGDVT